MFIRLSANQEPLPPLIELFGAVTPFSQFYLLTPLGTLVLSRNQLNIQAPLMEICEPFI